MISHRQRCIDVTAPRCAGTSVLQVVRGAGRPASSHTRGTSISPGTGRSVHSTAPLRPLDHRPAASWTRPSLTTRREARDDRGRRGAIPANFRRDRGGDGTLAKRSIPRVTTPAHLLASAFSRTVRAACPSASSRSAPAPQELRCLPRLRRPHCGDRALAAGTARGAPRQRHDSHPGRAAAAGAGRPRLAGVCRSVIRDCRCHGCHRRPRSERVRVELGPATCRRLPGLLPDCRKDTGHR